MNIEIEKNVPIPPKKGPIQKCLYPFRDMEVGDSFYVADKKASDLSGARGLAVKQTGFTFATRTVEGGVRVWRTA